MRFSSLRIALAGALVGVALSACVVVPAPGYYSGDVVAYQEPPPPQYEAIGVAPGPGFFWIGGGWFWEGGRYAWHPGHWDRERPGYRWVPHGWERRGNAWHMRRGHWEHR
jgi:WXXGXW repeat (2 copies)